MAPSDGETLARRYGLDRLDHRAVVGRRAHFL